MLWWQTDWFPFIYCLETLDRSTAAKNWKSCVHPSHLDLDPLLECSASPLGAKVTSFVHVLKARSDQMLELEQEDFI